MKNLNKTTKDNLITYGMVIAAYIIVEILLKAGVISSLLQGLLVPLCVYVVLAISLNLVVGISGELSLGHAGFMCVGAFAGAFFSNSVKDVITAGEVRIFLALLVGAAAAAVFGLLIGIPVLRLRGDYLAIVTLAFGEIIKNVVNVFYVGIDGSGLHISMKDKASMGLAADGNVIINGPQGITGTPKDSTFTIGILLILVTLFVVLNLINSRDGRAIKSIRDNRIAAESVGLNITKYKLMAFAVSASLAGAAGVLYAHNLASLQASKFSFNTSILVLVFVVLGGIGNIRGSIIAAVVLTLLPELLRALNDYRMLIYAVVLIAMMLFTSSPAGMAFRERFSLKRLRERTNEKEEAQ
ncbi:MAG: branched-chain amino acid ABC transporter permease [Lachnospiraceae bacterium]|nr:branched-chain amino acid ABC transporter permease [Lachnospiraceae bacterium]